MNWKRAAIARVCALSFAALPATGICLYGDDHPANQTPPPNGAPWRHVARVGAPDGSGVYLGKRFIITANHVQAIDEVLLDGVTYARDTAFSPRRIGGDDIKLFRIASKPNLPTLPLIAAADNDLVKRCTMIGWGLGTGAPVANQGWNWNDIRKQRWGLNNTLGILGNADGFERLLTAFNFGSASNEASVANTDSGGGLFVKVAGVWKLAGVAVDADSNGAFYDHDTTKAGNQADRSYFVRIKNHRAQIKKIMAAATP
jgi:hypothetical protein